MAQKGLAAGTRLTAAVLDGAYAQGVIAQGQRTSTKALAGTEGGVLRLDSMALKSGNSYWVVAHGIRVSVTGTPTNDHYAARLRYNAAGAAGTADNEIGRNEWTPPNISSAYDSAPTVHGWVNPTSDTSTGSVILTIFRVSGTGTTPTLQMDGGGLWLTVIDLGLAVPNTGVII